MISLIYTLQVGFERVLLKPNLITYASYCLTSTSNKLRAQVADVLAALCVLSLNDGHRAVLSSLSDFRVVHQEKYRFEFLVESLGLKEMRNDGSGSDLDSLEDSEEANIWEYRTAAMSLINAITNSPEDLEERMMLRDEFSRRGLNEVMTVSLDYR